MSDIAVVIPVRNRPEIIKRALFSVARQSLQPQEVFVVDDCSDDGTADEAERFSAGMRNVRIIRQLEHRGAPAARNLGIRLAQAELVAFLDSDDEWEHNKLETQEAFLSQNPDYCACFCQFKHRHPYGEYLSGSSELQVTAPMLFARNIIGSTSTALVRRSALNLIGGFDETLRSCQDWDLWLKLSDTGKLYVLADPLLIYHYDDHNRISRDYERLMEGLSVVFERILSRVDPKETNKVKAHQKLLLAALHASRWPNWQKLVSHGLQGLMLYPSVPVLEAFARNMWRYARHRKVTLQSS